MNHPLSLLCATVATIPLLMSPVLAQEDAAMGAPKPAKELEKYSKLLGYWEGEGTSKSGPQKPTTRWTSSAHVRKVLDGHFVREDTRIGSTLVHAGDPRRVAGLRPLLRSAHPLPGTAPDPGQHAPSAPV